MKLLKLLLIGAASVTASGAVFAQADPRITINVASVPPSITLARDGSEKVNKPLETFAAYQVNIINGGSSALNRVFLNGTASNIGGADPILYDSFVATKPGDLCGVGAANNRVACTLLSLAPGESTTFVVVFKGPKNGTRIDFVWTAGGFEGNGGGNGCCSQTNTASTNLVDPSTDASFKSQAKTFVKPSTGGTLFTGSEAITTSSDGWSTTVVVPSYTAQSFTVAAINERNNTDPVPPGDVPLACPPYSTNSTCFTSQLSIPGTFDSLVITLRLDKTYFNLGRTDPATVPLYYRGDIGKTPPSYVVWPHKLELCSTDAANPSLIPYGPVPLPGRPCLIVPPRVIPNSDPIKDLRGDLEYKAAARDNGRYAQ